MEDTSIFHHVIEFEHAGQAYRFTDSGSGIWGCYHRKASERGCFFYAGKVLVKGRATPGKLLAALERPAP